ncbi:FKBP-type peptidyl-prolyl cis-trans isomerase [Larkinella arboricola]|uniref:Peptidyl-prolyl cis-trans isomerase n=1 Tax=Larkinella arboricola TaxID=643671 RepID=A0A327X9U4_LARAB|nr:FKBP-type peptidyl-prolyl cis-trans isomerase [Larkinella arboricola]RAK02402.1 FKBP-type peptidyl-prolyl cis-trans isomerase [Larkinella arboricola]
MNLKSIGTLSLLVAALAACDNNRVQVTENGLKYKFHEDVEDTPKAKVGDVMTFNITVKNSKDSTLGSSYTTGSPVKQPLQASTFKGSLEEGLALLSKGDSATIYVNADSIAARSMQPLPPFIPKGSDIAYTIKVIDIQSMEEFQKAQVELREKQKGVDAKTIADYVAKNKLAAQKTASGLYYVITQPGAGAQPANGDVVKVKYTGKLMDGKVFDSSDKQPQTQAGIDFPLGQGAVIPGWEEGIRQLRKGAKGTLIIPSGLAYGTEGAPGAIPPNSVIMFDVELVDIKKGAAPTPPQMPQMPQGGR